jgi:hypothetical protein
VLWIFLKWGERQIWSRVRGLGQVEEGVWIHVIANTCK